MPKSETDFHQSQTLTRMTWIEPDGTEHEFHDVANSGGAMPSTDPLYNCQTNPLTGGPNRGNVFESDDATAATFISDNTIYDAITTSNHFQFAGEGVSGWLLFSDGTRYQTDTYGNVIQIVDRNGNYTTLQYGGSACASAICITDSLGRTTGGPPP